MLYILLFWVPHKLLKIKNLMFSRRLISWGFYILLISNLTVIGSLIWHQLSSFFQPAWSLNCQRSCITILEKKRNLKGLWDVCVYIIARSWISMRLLFEILKFETFIIVSLFVIYGTKCMRLLELIQNCLQLTITVYCGRTGVDRTVFN